MLAEIRCKWKVNRYYYYRQFADENSRLFHSDKVQLVSLVVTNTLMVTVYFLKKLGSYMSDKFFFQGRQDARQNNLKFGYERNASRISGSKKYPLMLVVTSETRKQEVESLVAEADLHAEISIDTSEGAVESIFELTVLLNRKEAVTVVKVPARNEPCSCGSGKKYKKCCG
ncbi:MAG: SWIM/SEC-C metal-binding protein [Alphaproteobacteria bacterium]|jgi:SWIM/SEC-C metal-binding protein